MNVIKFILELIFYGVLVLFGLYLLCKQDKVNYEENCLNNNGIYIKDYGRGYGSCILRGKDNE